jgi:hypothetical protein
MKEDISTLERNARLMMQQKEYPGYRGCSAVGNTLHFYFDTPDNAQTCSFEIGFDSDRLSINGSTLIVDFNS